MCLGDLHEPTKSDKQTNKEKEQPHNKYLTRIFQAQVQTSYCSYKLYLHWCYFTETKDAVTDPNAKGIEYIDEKVDGENNNIDRDEDAKSEVDEDSDKGSEQDEDEGALHINTVNLRSQARENERVHLRVCVEITHPALKLPVYRTWTGTAHPGH